MNDLEKIYEKLTKKELIKLLIENNKVKNFSPYQKIQVPYHEICSCNPKNGGSGICGCTMGNTLVERNLDEGFKY